ncbi:uncharacterized protein LOC116201738 [Punica granatum]|uniref:Uncharacterized protein n=2 Tax=Punica granatum TaxID=22663 RepID=A0A218WVG2_PUNGR|nr:uncharacterized protein LOC116201738 [Punica granatum]OWM76586.1 hypothetical protein CDL15_Pgr005550 [Punica granatum]PKI43947.1 hypothetical protein CRG98_035623 [Punica granatum]
MAEPKEPQQHPHGPHSSSPSPSPVKEKDVKAPNILERAKEEMEAVFHAGKDSPHRHHKETHGMSDDIDENTPVDEVKGPNVFQRVKEEIEALAEAVHPKKDSDDR